MWKYIKKINYKETVLHGNIFEFETNGIQNVLCIYKLINIRMVCVKI